MNKSLITLIVIIVLILIFVVIVLVIRNSTVTSFSDIEECATDIDCLVYGNDGDCGCGCFNYTYQKEFEEYQVDASHGCFCKAPKACVCKYRKCIDVH